MWSGCMQVLSKPGSETRRGLWGKDWMRWKWETDEKHASFWEAIEKSWSVTLLKLITHDNIYWKVLGFHQFISYLLLFAQLFLLGGTCSQAWNKLQQSHHGYFHSVVLVVVFIITVSPHFQFSSDRQPDANGSICIVLIDYYLTGFHGS